MPDADPAIIANPERLASLRRLCLLDTPTDPAFDRLTQLASRILGAPIALVSLVDDRRQFFKSQIGLDEPWASLREMPLDYSYCQHVVATHSPLIIDDSRQHPLVYDLRSTNELGIAAYAGIPLTTSDGDTLGSFCVADTQARIWTDNEIAILADLAQSVMTEIELRDELRKHQQTEAALRTSEQHLQAVISGAPVIVYVVDQQGHFLMSEGKGLEVINVKANRIAGRSIYEVYGDQPDILASYEQALTGKTLSILTEQQTPVGALHYEVRFSPFYDLDNQVSGAIAVATDVTERVWVEDALKSTIERLTLLRRVEVELSESLDLTSVLTIAMDTALRASGAEHGFIALLESDHLRIVHAAGNYTVGTLWDTEKGVVGRALRTHEAQLVPDVDSDADFIADIPGVRAQMAIPLIHRDHLIGVLNLKTKKPELFTPAGFDFLTMIASHLTVAIDNAQLYQVSQQQLEELHQLYMRVSELEQLKTDMIRIAAHDLRNPLGAVTGYAELLLGSESALTSDERLFIESIYASGQKMFTIINDILSLQRIEAARDHEQYEKVNLAELIHDTFASSAPRAHLKSLQYHLSLPPTPLWICADPAQMREAIDNLISNAIKYTPEGGAIAVRLELEASRMVFEVEDTGYGIPTDQQNRLFQPFFRASNARASEIEGTGLGLHLVKNIIERHGGRMRFQSVLGKGSLFGFELPIKLD